MVRFGLAWLLPLFVALGGCNSGDGNASPSPSADPKAAGSASPTPASSESTAPTPAPDVDAEKPFRTPKDGDQVAVLDTDDGKIILGFLPDKAPNHVKNFIKLATNKTYDGTRFHRTIPGFMIQGGDPLSKQVDKQAMWGSGDAGYKIKAEFNDVPHVRGILSMARAQDPDSAGSQFFIMVAENRGLDGQYSAFGYVIKGMDVADKIVARPSEDGSGRALDPCVVKSVKIVKWPVKD